MSVLFFATAALYAAVGFGGGSTYSALLALANTDYLLLPSVALVCNIIVVTGGTVRFHLNGMIPWKDIWPLLTLSVPMAWLGGRLMISEWLFILLLGLALLFAGGSMLFRGFESSSKGRLIAGDNTTSKTNRRYLAVIGAALGLLSGIVGIGGGIFLAPLLYLLRWSSAKIIAAVCSVFILVNSVAGLSGQISKLDSIAHLSPLAGYWPLFLAVFVGGQIGSYMASNRLNADHIRILTSALILVVAVRLLIRSMTTL